MPKAFLPTDLRCEGLDNPLGVDCKAPRLSWRLTSEDRGIRQSAYQILCASRSDFLDESEADYWNSGRIEGSESQWIPYAGKEVAQGSLCHWKVRIWNEKGESSEWSAPSHWSFFSLRQDRDWEGKWITHHSSSPWLRKSFYLEELPDLALAYVNALGYFHLYVNGSRVGDDEFLPHIGQYDKRTFCVTKNITEQLKVGENLIGIWLGSGWNKEGAGIKVDPCVRAQFELSGTHGSEVCLFTDESWKARPSSHSYLGKWCWNQFGGEEHRGEAELPDWSYCELDDSDWSQATEMTMKNLPVSSSMLQSSRVLALLRPQSVTQVKPGEWLVDMGKAMTGICEVRCPSGPKGQRVVLEFGDHYEMDLETGGLKLNHFNQISEYVYRGDGEEIFRQVFNYASFRFILIRNLPVGDLKSSDIKGRFISLDCSSVSSFECSDSTLNEIHRMMEHTLRCLMLGGYQVDCHSRERYGYGGDGQSSLDTTLCLFRSDTLYRKWSQDWLDGQNDDGGLTYTSPASGHGGGPFWCGFLVASTLKHYLHYGDLDLVSRNYTGIKKWLELAQRKTKEGLQEKFCGGWYLGDWASPEAIDDQENAEVFIQCYMVYVLKQSAQLADYLGNIEDAETFRSWAESRALVTHRKHYDPVKKKYGTGDQVTYIMSLVSGVCPDDLKEDLFREFERVLLVRDKGHLSTGLSGTYMMVQYLQSVGRHDLIYEFSSKRTYPSWGYMLENGATATWEHWEGIRSRIHNCYNNIASWFIQGLVGIQPDPAQPGFKKFVIKPSYPDNVEHASGSHNSIYGLIKSRWKKVEGEIELEILVPPNTSAVVYFPCRKEEIVRIDLPNDAWDIHEDLSFLDSEEGISQVAMSSGKHSFRFCT